LFVVGDKTEHARISELGNLDKLSGKLQIKNINYVKDPDDAEKVHLSKKIGIRKLSLDWYSREKDGACIKVRTEEVSLLNMEKDLGLLNSLEPPSDIENLRISGYGGLQLPHWMAKQSSSSYLSDMNMLKQSNLPQFSYLSKLVLENLPNLVHLWGLKDLPGIKILKLRVMPKLVEFVTATTALPKGEDEDEAQCCFPHLLTLVISDCPKLNVKPYFPLSLRELTLEGNNEQLLSSGSFFCPPHAHCGVSSSFSSIMDVKPLQITHLKLGGLIGSSSSLELLQQLNGLRELEISRCKGLRNLPESMRSLTCLQKLDINWCDNLILPEWLGELESLRTLRIIGLPEMSTLPGSIQRLTSLQDLYIYYCHALHWVPEQLGELRSLRRLQLCDLPGLTSLPEGLQCLTSLLFLNLCNCATFKHLPESLGKLPALKTFWIQACPALTSLPCCIKRLVALEELCINNCPELVRRCKESVGEDWHLVSHIPCLTLS
jgi:Leucine-rich repeat (LRR) protein